MFPDLFPKGRGHYDDLKQLLEFQPSVDSYGKYIKLRMLVLIPGSDFIGIGRIGPT